MMKRAHLKIAAGKRPAPAAASLEPKRIEERFGTQERANVAAPEDGRPPSKGPLELAFQ